MVDDEPGHDLQAVHHGSGLRAPVVLDQGDEHPGSAFEPPVTFAEHGVGLAHPGSGPEIDAQVTACHVSILPVPASDEAPPSNRALSPGKAFLDEALTGRR